MMNDDHDFTTLPMYFQGVRTPSTPMILAPAIHNQTHVAV